MDKEHLGLLNEINRKLQQAHAWGEDAVWKSFVDATSAALGCEAASFFYADDKAKRLTIKFGVGECAGDIENLSFSYQGIAGLCAQERKSFIINDVSSDPRFCVKVDHATGFKTKTVLCSPIISGNTLIGVIELINPQKSKFTDEDKDLMEFLCAAAVKTTGHPQQ